MCSGPHVRYGLGNHQENNPLILLKDQLIMPLAASTLNIQGLITPSEQHLMCGGPSAGTRKQRGSVGVGGGLGLGL